MASKFNNKKKITPKKEEETSLDYYKLKVDAVNSLVDALNQDPHAQDQKNVTPDDDQPDPYKIDKLSKIPTSIKVLFVKFWVAGAICYFIRMGLGVYITDPLDMLVLTGIVTGLVTDLFVNTAFLYFESDKKEYHKYMLVPVSCKKIWTLFVNIPYGLIEVIAIHYIYVFLNMYVVNGNLVVEPLLYGIIFLLVDMAFISIKNLIVMLIGKRKKVA